MSTAPPLPATSAALRQPPWGVRGSHKISGVEPTIMHPTGNRGGSTGSATHTRPIGLRLPSFHKISPGHQKGFSLGHQKGFRKHSTLQPCTAQLKHVCMHSYTRRLCRSSQHPRHVYYSARNICTNIFQWCSCPIKTNAPSGVADQASAAAQLADWLSTALHTAAGAARRQQLRRKTIIHGHTSCLAATAAIMLPCSSK